MTVTTKDAEVSPGPAAPQAGFGIGNSETGILEAERMEAEELRGSWMGWRGLLLNFTFWTGFALLTAANFLAPTGGQSQPFLRTVLIISFFEAYVWAVLTPLIFWLVSRYSVEQGRRRGRAVIFIAAAPAVALMVGVAGYLVLAPSGTAPSIDEEWRGILGVLIRLRLLNNVLIYLAIVAAGVARDSSLRYRARREQTIRMQAKSAQLQARLQAQLAEARLAVLRSQLNPHFLFNTLNALSALVDEDPPRAQRMIARLSDLLRYTLEGAGEREIPLWRELRLTERYLEILEIRYHGRLQTNVVVDPVVREALVPSLILQPLAENAMKHGVSGAGGYGRIDISARRSGDELVLTVRDTGSGEGTPALDDGATSPAGGIGLSHTRARLAELYGARQSVILRRGSDGATIAEITLPFRVAADPLSVA
jgi:two-component system LytT family sensor kinase